MRRKYGIDDLYSLGLRFVNGNGLLNESVNIKKKLVRFGYIRDLYFYRCNDISRWFLGSRLDGLNNEVWYGYFRGKVWVGDKLVRFYYRFDKWKKS